MNLGPTELLILLGIILVLFGARKLPELARSMGRSLHEFRRGLTDSASPEEERTPS
jgi:sec-independent protein translocase protein TatA